MASGGAEEEDGGVPLDIDNVHMLLQVEHEQIQKRTFTNWINAQLSKRCSPSFVSDLFSDLRDGSRLLDLLEVMSGQSMKRQRGSGVFQQRANIETALNFLKRKSIKLVNINIPDILEGRPSITLGLVWTIILRCHIEELASALTFSSRHSSLDSLASLDSWSGSSAPASPVPAGRTSPLHRRFRLSAKKALLMWVRDQCQRVHCSVSVKDFKSSWRSGEAFLAILCSLRPELVDLSLVQSRSNKENLEEAFHLAERELHIPRLLEPQDVDVKDPEEKSIMTYVAQFLQYSSDMPSPDDHLQLFPLDQPSVFSPMSSPAHFTPAIAASSLHQISPRERAQEVTVWLQQTYEELTEAWTSAEKSGYAEKYQVFQSLAASFTEQRRPVMTLLAAVTRRPELNQEQSSLRTAWHRLEEELQRCKADLDRSLPPPLDSVAVWLQRAEAALAMEGGKEKDHRDAAKEARAQQDTLKNLTKEMSHYVNILDTYKKVDDSGNGAVPLEKFDELKKRLTNIRVTAKYQGIKLEYQESHHTVLDLLSNISAKVQSWKPPYGSQESVNAQLQDWHETIERQGLHLILTDALQNLKEKTNAHTSKAALSEDSQLVTRQLREAENEAELVTQAVTATRGMMERVATVWETYNKSLSSLQAWLEGKTHPGASAAATQDMSEQTSCQALLNEAGNFLIEATEASTSLSLSEQLSKVNKQWAECMKKTMFEVLSEPGAGALCLQTVHSLTQEASWLLRQPLEVASITLKANRQKLQLLSKKITEVDMSSLRPSPDFQTSHLEKLLQTLPQTLSEAERTCGELQQTASRLEGSLAELDHWSTDALDRYNHLKEKMQKGHSAKSKTKGLFSRGLQLMNQVVTEGQELQDLVAGLQKASPLQQLSASDMQDRISETISHGQEILEMFRSLGFEPEVPKNLPPFKTACETQKQAETGLVVVARTKHVNQIGNVTLRTKGPDQPSPQVQSHTPQQRRGVQHKHQNPNTQEEEEDVVVPHVVIHMIPQPSRELVSHIQSPVVQTSKEVSSAQASSFTQDDQPLPAPTQAPAGLKSPASPVLSKFVSSSATDEMKTSPPAQPLSTKNKSRTREQPSPLQSSKPPQPPVVVCSEVRSKAQSMARSRLEKARTHLQGRIQQAMKLFGGKEVSESQVKKKQKALKVLQPAVLEEFLVAVEGFEAFCSGPQLQDLQLLSESVRKQWEDVRREMAAFVPVLWSMIREGTQSFSAVHCETLTNALSEATDNTDYHWSQQQQAATEGDASVEERGELLKELCETLTPGKSSSLSTERLAKLEEAQEEHPSYTAFPAGCRGRQLGGDIPLRATDSSSDMQLSNHHSQKQSPQQDLWPAVTAVSARPHGAMLLRDVPSEAEDHLMQNRDGGAERNKKSSLRAKEQLLKACVLNTTESSEQAQTQTQIQAVVRSNTVETKQEAEWTVIPETQEVCPSEQEALESYRKSCSVFQSQIQKNKLHLENIPDPVTISTLVDVKKQLQALKQKTDALWFDVELRYALLSHLPQLRTRKEIQAEVETNQKLLTQQRRDDDMCLQTRMASLEHTADMMQAADDQKTLITEKLNQIIRQPVDISSLTLPDPAVLSDLKEMDDRLQDEMRKLSEQSTGGKRLQSEVPSSLCQALHNSVHHIEQLRQRLEKVQSAALALDRFLVAARDVEAEIPALLANQDPSRLENEADREQGGRSWQAAMQRLQSAVEQSDNVDRTLKAAGMTLSVDGATVTCQDVVKSVSKHVVEMERKLMGPMIKQGEEEISLMEKGEIQENVALSPFEIHQTKMRDDSPQQTRTEEESELEAKKSKSEEGDGTKTQRLEGFDVLKTKDQKRQRRRSKIKREGDQEGFDQRRDALLAALRETKGAAEQLRLQEATLPALQQRKRALTELESHLASLLPELHYIRGASSQPGNSDDSQTREVEDLWEETMKAVTERLEQCCALTELLKSFQSVRGELSGTLQRAESTISEQASYMGRDNLQRLHAKVQETKAELNGIGDDIEEVRSICRQLHARLRQIPECTAVPFESEADALMDRWLDLSERLDSHLENLHRGLTLWDGVLQLGTEVESWTDNKLAMLAQCPSFQTEDDVKMLQNEIATQEESIQRFHRRAVEIQSLLQSTESPLELQVVETQLLKKMEELKELFSEAEDVYKQMVVTKGQISRRMEECFNSLQKIQDALLSLRGPDVAAVLAKLKDLSLQLHSQDEQAGSLLEDVRVMTSIAGPESLQSLSVNGLRLQEKVRDAHQLFSEVEEQTERNIRDLDRLQVETDLLQQWLHAAEEKAAKEEELSLLQEEALEQSVRAELIGRLVSSLQSSDLQLLAQLEESRKLMDRYHKLSATVPSISKEAPCSMRRDIEAFQALSTSTQSWVSDLRQIADSRLVESIGIQSPVEQRLLCAQAMLSATSEGEHRLEELRATGESLSRRLLDGDDLKREVQETIQKTEQQWRELLQSAEPHCRILQADPELTSLYLAQRQEVCRRLEELQHRTDQLPALFPWPGTDERTQACLLASQLRDDSEDLRLTLTGLAEQRRVLAERTGDAVWNNSSWAELDTRWSALMDRLKSVCSRFEEHLSDEEHFGRLLQNYHLRLTSLQEKVSACQTQKESSAGLNADVTALEALLQDLEKDLLRLTTLKDSITNSCTAEARASLSLQVSNLQNHKMALESSIRETLKQNQRIQRIKEETSCLQTALRDLADNVGSLSGGHDIIQLKQQWCTIQDLDTRLTEVAAGVNNQQSMSESSVPQEMLPADVILSVSAAFKELASLRSSFLQKQQQCAESTADGVREVVSQLQQWSRRVQADPSSHSQVALDEGLQLQHSLNEVLSEQDFLLNSLGAEVTKDLEDKASGALSESQSVLETLNPKSLVSHSRSGVQQDLQDRSDEDGSASTDETTAFLSSPASDSKEGSGRDQTYQTKTQPKGILCTLEKPHPSPEPVKDTSNASNVDDVATKQDQSCTSALKANTLATESFVERTEEDASAPVKAPCSEIPDVLRSNTQQESQRLISAPPKLNDQDDSATSSMNGTLSGNNAEPFVSDLSPALDETLLAQQQNIQPSAWVLQIPAVATDNTKDTRSAHSVPPLEDAEGTRIDNVPSSHLSAQSETCMAATDEEDKRLEEDMDVTAKKVFTLVLDTEPRGVQQWEDAGAFTLDVLRCSQEVEPQGDAKILPEKKPGLLRSSVSPEPDKGGDHSAAQSETFKAFTDAQGQERFSKDVSGNPDKVFTIVLDVEPVPWDLQQSRNVVDKVPDVLRRLQGAELCGANVTKVSETDGQKSTIFSTLPGSDETDLSSLNTKLEEVKSDNEVLSSSKASVSESQLLTDALRAETCPDVKQEEVTDSCDPVVHTLISALGSVDDSVLSGDDEAGDEQETAADVAQATDTAQEETGNRGESREEENDFEYAGSKHSEETERQDSALDQGEQSEWMLPAAAEDTEETQGQPQIPESMDPESTAPGSSAAPAAGETTGGSPKSCKDRSTMQEVLSGVQSLVERSNIINRTPHTDLNWYLKSSPGEPEIRLLRTVQQVLACRYQPAQLSVSAMVKQLEEAEEFRCCVHEQVAAMKSSTGALKSAEGQWSAALLDASATVQVKAAQLDQVKQYHRQMKITRAFLEVLAAEKEKMSLNALGSSAVQAERLNALLQTMEQKRDMMEDLLLLSSQLSVHLSDAESSGALLAQLGDVQEEWRLLEGSIKRALQQASNSTSQHLILFKEAEHLKANLEALQQSVRQSHDSKSALELVCLTTDLKLYNQLYLRLRSQSNALISFSLGQKEKGEIGRNLQELESLLSVTKRMLDSFTCNPSAKMNRQLRDLIIWAKQAENHISIGKKLALFPEEARIQIVEMRKFQTDIMSRRSKMKEHVEEMKASEMETEESDEVFKTVEDLYEAIAESLDHVLDTMKKNLTEREKLLSQLASVDAWLAETHVKRDPCNHIENVSKADIRKLESELKSHTEATVEIERQLKLVEAVSESCRNIATGLSPGESRYLVNRLSGLWTELDGMLAHEKATSWELEELIHERTCSDEELSAVQASLKDICADLEQQKFPLTQETLSTIAHLKYMLMEHQCQVQELQHCQEAKRSALLCSVGELQDRCKALSTDAYEQDKYLHLRRQMEESRDIADGQIQHAKNKAMSVGERFRLCQVLLVELPLVKTQCQEAADQLEAISQGLHPSELNAEREKIQQTVETLVSWERSVTDDIKSLEAKLLLGLRFNSELTAVIELLQNTRVELEGAQPVSPEEKAIDIALQRCWVIWRNMESGMRVLEGLGRKEKINLGSYKELVSLKEAAMHECHSQMISLSQTRESLKDYQWAAQGAIGFLHNAEATFLSAPGGFLDCTEEQRQTQQALEALEDGFQAHICHLAERLPQQPCLSHAKTEQLHISILSQLLVGRAVLEAQAQLRMESLQRCEITQESHRKCHEDIRQRLSGFENRLSECAAEQVTSYDKCVAQQRRAKLLMEDLRSLAGKIEDLRAGCPMQGCGVGKGGELGALWRRWVSLRRGLGLLMTHTEQRGEEWRDITASMEQCCSCLASLQAEVPDTSTVSFIQEEPQELLAQAEMHQVGLEQEQQALASLEHRLEHALSLSICQESLSPGPVGKTLVKIQENVRSLKERNLLIVAAAQAEEKERLQFQEEIGEVEKHVLPIIQALDSCSNPSKTQELRMDLSSQRAKLTRIVDSVQSRYAEIPADIGRIISEVQMSLQSAEDELMETSSPVRTLTGRVRDLGSGLERVKALLEQKSPTISEAQNVLKHVWDELDAWRSSLMLLESEVQDLAEEQPDQAQLLIDQLTQPLQLYQDAAQKAEHRTAFLSKVPTCLQELEDILHSATCWLDEAHLWLSTSCSFTTARSLQDHAKSLQLVLDDSERIRNNLQNFRPALAEVSAVCDVSTQVERLEQNDQRVHQMQQDILEPLDQLQQTVAIVDVMEAELKAVEKNVPKISAILSSVDISSITLTEHLHNRQVILANVLSMRTMLEDIERCRGEILMPQEAEDLQVFSRARLLLQTLEELEQLTQQQASLLENKIKEENETQPDTPTEMQQLDRSPHRLLVQESNSEEEEDEDDDSHSSSSDTLTCSIPEDLEETLKVVQSEDMAETNPLSDVQELERLSDQFPSGYKLLSVTPGFDFKPTSVEAGLLTQDSSANIGKSFSAKTSATVESLNTSAIPATGDQFKTASAADQHEPPEQEATDASAKLPQAAAAAVEDTRVIPSRPITPFTAKRASDGFMVEEDLTSAPPSDLDTFNRQKEQSEVSTSHGSFVDESQQQELSEEPISLTGHEDDQHQRWNQLHSQISQKLTTLKKVKEEHQSLTSTDDGGDGEKVPKRTTISTGSASAVLQLTRDSITMLRQIAAGGSDPGMKEEFYEAVRRVLLCLDSLTDLLLTPIGEDGPELRLLQQECVSTELVTLAELLSKLESESRDALSEELPDVSRCLISLQECLRTVQLVFTSSHNQVTEHPQSKQQDLSSTELCLLDEFDLGQCEIFPSVKDAPSLECGLARHLRESPGEKAKLQHSSRSLLQGIARLLDLGEECITGRKASQVHSCGELQGVLCRHKKLLQVLRCQTAFVQYLLQHEPEALNCLGDEWVQLEARTKALQQQALDQDVASERRLQEWTCWADNCSQLGKVLDESDTFISSGEPEGDDEEELVQHRIDTCQQTLIQLDESRACLGLLLDQATMLQAEPGFTSSVSRTGGALELRWRSAERRARQEIQRCKDIQDVRARFQADFASLSERLVGANRHLKALSAPADAPDLDQDCVQSNLVKLLDFSMEVEDMSVLMESVSKDGTQLLHLREADSPGVRTHLTQMEASMKQLTSDLSKTQEQLQQQLQATQPPVGLVSDLEDWLKQLEAQLNQEKERVLKATNAAQITEILQRYQVLKAAMGHGQLLLDFLCQPGAQMVVAENQAVRSERTTFAEKLGSFRLRWLQLERELESQTRGAEQTRNACAGRERRLQSLRVWTEEQKKQLNQWKQPTSLTLARKALLEWEAVVNRVKEVAAAVQELKTRRVLEEKQEEHPSDVAFSKQADSVSHACMDLSQQMEALRPSLQQTIDEWSCFRQSLDDVTLYTTRLRCSLQHQRAPLFSLKQAEGHSDFLQLHQEKVGNGKELWAAVEKSRQRLVEVVHSGAAQALHDRVEGERKRWKEMVQEINDAHVQTRETLSVWREYARLSDSCSLRLQHLSRQWKELSSSSLTPERDTQAMVCSVKELQDAAEELQSVAGDVLAASKPLIGRLEPLAASLIQSETRLLSRDILLLNQEMSGKRKSLQEDLEQQKLFHIQLEAIEKQTKTSDHKLKAGIHSTDALQVLSELCDLFPSLVDLGERSVYGSLNNQETERLHKLGRAWLESVSRASDMNRELQGERHRFLSFQEKCKNLKSLQEKLEQESTSRKPPSYSSLRETLSIHQRLQAEVIIGHQLLQGLLCDAVESMEKETGEKRSELMAQVARLKDGWFSSIAQVGHNRTLLKEQLRQWRVFHRGLKLLWKLVRDVESLLPPAGPALCTLQQLQNSVKDCQCAEECLGLHTPVCTQTLEAGKHLCETMTESECQDRLQSELQAMEEAWERTSSLLGRRKHLVNATVQTWSQCQDRITNIMSQLDELKLKISLPIRPEGSEEEALIQETELSLQRLATGLRDLATMKTDLSQYVAASDSALLEQQLEQLHGQWEELCMKVSLRRQEIADRLNAWTIFNDKNKEFCDWLTQMENKVCCSGDLSIEEMVEKLKKDCMEEINLFSENKSHLKQLGEQLLLASDEAKQTQVHRSLQEVNQRWHNLFHHIEARVKKLKETLVTMQQLDKNMSNLRSWLCRIEAELSRPITYSFCHEQEIQRRLAEQQELQRDIEQHTEGVVSVLSLCDVLLRDEDAGGGTEAESDSLQETSRSLDQRWRTICAMALDRRLRIEETWRLWCKFLNDYSRFEDWLKMAERTAASPNSADVPYTVAKEELKKFESFQRQVHERLTQLELVNNQYRRLARENRTDRASQLKAMVHEGNRRWDTLHRRVAAILRRLKYFTSQREEFEGTRESMLVWLTELDLQLTNVEHFSESDVLHKIQQLNSFQKEITLNTERIDGLIVFGEGLIQRSSPQDAALIEDELEELHSYCQEVFSRLVRFHQRLSQPPIIREEPDLSRTTFSLESSLELIGRPWLGRSLGSLPATPTHLLASPLERSGRETPVSVDSLPLEWDHTGDVGGSSSHEDDEEEEEHEEEGAYFSALSVSSRSMAVHGSPRWRPPAGTQLDSEEHAAAPSTLTSTPLKQGYLRLMSQCSGSIEDIKRVSLILDDEEQPEEFGLTGLATSDQQSGVIERWELAQAQSRNEPEPSDLDSITSWLENVIPDLDSLQQSEPATINDMEAAAKELKEMQKTFARYKSIMLSLNLRAEEAPELQDRLMSINRDWSRACTGLQGWDTSLRKRLMRCQEFHETLHSLLLWLAHAESRRYAVDISHPDTTVAALQQHSVTLTALQEELQVRQAQQTSLQALWSQLQPEDGAEESIEAQEKLHVTGSKLKLLLREVDQDLAALQQRLDCECASAVQDQNTAAETPEAAARSKNTTIERREAPPPRSFFYRVLRAAFPLQLLLIFLLLLPCLIPTSESDTSCTVTNNFARSFHPMLRYTNGPPPT